MAAPCERKLYDFHETIVYIFVIFNNVFCAGVGQIQHWVKKYWRRWK